MTQYAVSVEFLFAISAHAVVFFQYESRTITGEKYVYEDGHENSTIRTRV